MKRVITKVTIIVRHPHNVYELSNWVEIMRGDFEDSVLYPLTERNYWRAVGLQLCLAGFVNHGKMFLRHTDYNPLDAVNYQDETA